MSVSDQESLHIRIAEMFESQLKYGPHSSPQLIAQHYSKAAALARNQGGSIEEIVRKAVFWWHETAKVAMNSLALPEALEALTEAHNIVGELERKKTTIRTELQILLDTAIVYYLLLGPVAQEVQNAYRQAKKLAKLTDEVSLVFWFNCKKVGQA